MSDYDYESVRNFITIRHKEVIQNEVHEAEKETRQAVTLRLPRGHVALVDRLAKELDYNRQDFLSQLLDVALQDCIKAMSDLHLEGDRMNAWKSYMATMDGADGSAAE